MEANPPSVLRRNKSLKYLVSVTALFQFAVLGSVLMSSFAMIPQVFADGCYMPERAVRKIPTIPSQCAVITWKGGVETLTISSALDSESQKLGWIIPLPSVPDLIEKESPGSLKSLNFCIQPKITHDLRPGLPAVIFWVFLLNVLLYVGLFRSRRFMDLIITLVILFLLLGLLMPALSSSRGALITGSTTVRLERTAKVGSYDINVLSAKKAEDLNVWLGENDFALLPMAATQTIANYIRDGWVFATIKFTRAESGANAPHPIRMKFNAKEAIYPLKLTAIAGGSTAFDLFVITNERTACKLLSEEFCDRFNKVDGGVFSYGDYETKELYKGNGTGLWVGHPAICKMMWNGCVLTKLTGEISSGMMTEDLRFASRPFKVQQMHFYSRVGAREISLMLLVALFGVSLFVSMIVCAKRTKEPKGKWWYFGKVLFLSGALSGLCALALFFALPKLPASEVKVSKWIQGLLHARELGMGLFIQFNENSSLMAKSEGQISDYLLTNVWRESGKARYVGDKPKNQIMGDDLKVEDTPGNFTVEKGATNIVIRVYDQTGRPFIYNIPIDNQGSAK